MKMKFMVFTDAKFDMVDIISRQAGRQAGRQA
jgi:hypothetical protein